MARNKRKKIKDREHMKAVRKDAKRRWRNKKAQEKALKNAAALKPAGLINVQKAKDHHLAINQARERKKEKPAQPKKRDESSVVKEIDPVEIVRSEKSIGCGTFGVCYLAYYRSILVAVKEFRMNSNESRSDVKRDLLREARMVNHLGDHRNLPLLFGAVIKGEQLMLITQFHGEKGKSVTLSMAIKKKKLEKSEWLGITKGLCEGLSHVHTRQILHNDLKSNNVVVEKRNDMWNPVIIDFGKARFISDPKPRMALTASSQTSYKKRYPHIAPEIVAGSRRQSIQSDIFSLGRIVLSILDLLPTATAMSLRIAKRAILHNPAKRPSIEEIIAVL